jgi:hypothetical protein
MDFQFLLGLGIIIAWFAVVVWGAVSGIVEAKRTKNWEKVQVAALSAATIAGPLLTLMPDHVLFGGHTMGLGYILAIASWFAILCAQPRAQRILTWGLK